MTTLTVELPEPLTQQLQNSGLSPEQVEPLIIRLIQLYLHQNETRTFAAGFLKDDAFKWNTDRTDQTDFHRFYCLFYL